MTASAIDTNIGQLPAADQARTSIDTTGTTTTVTVTGSPLREFVATTSTDAPNLRLDGSFTNSAFVGGAAIPERFTVTAGNVIKKSVFRLGGDSFKDVIKFEDGAKARKTRIADFQEGDKLKYKGETYKYNDISGKGFEGLSKKEIKLI